MHLSIIVPAHNEERGIGSVLDELTAVANTLDIETEIIVVDDGSTDATATEVEARTVRLVRHEENRGYGAALKTGVRAAKGDSILITDADGTYPIDRISELLECAEDADMVVGARTGKNVQIPLLRRPAKYLINVLANYLSGTTIPDLNSGLRIFRKAIAERFVDILPSGFSFTTTITLAMICNSYEVRFVPIPYHQRTGKSKIRPIRDTLNFVQLIVRTVMYFNPLKIFLPLSFALFAASAGVLAYSYLMTPQVMDVTTMVLFVAGVHMIGIGLIADLIDKRSR